MAELQISDQVLPPGAARARFSHAKNALVSAQRFEETQTDFAGEMIARSVRLLRERPDILVAERRRIRHLLIDEYQDTNAAQDALVKLLGEGADSLCAVGDEDQAIYRWRGAEVEHILRFDEDFPGARIVPLERNYRSTAEILAAASGRVSRHRRRREKILR